MPRAIPRPDADVVLRETSPKQVRERWAQTKLRIQRRQLQARLDWQLHVENADNFLPVTQAEKDSSVWLDMLMLDRRVSALDLIERLAVRWCRLMHR